MAIDNENLEMVRFWIASHSDPDLDPDTDHHDAKVRSQKKITGLFGNFSHRGGGSSQFPKLL